jgi:hypothetical protein
MREKPAPENLLTGFWRSGKKSGKKPAVLIVNKILYGILNKPAGLYNCKGAFMKKGVLVLAINKEQVTMNKEFNHEESI